MNALKLVIAGAWPKLSRSLTLIWIAVLVVGAVYAVYNQLAEFGDILADVHLLSSGLSLVLIVIGKVLTVVLVWSTLRRSGRESSWKFAWRAYSFADIAKYLPGGIWGITSRVAIYKGAGIPIGEGSRVLMVETLLLIAFSFATGVAALLPVVWPSVVGWVCAIVLLAGLTAVCRFHVAQLLLPVPYSTLVALLASWLCFGLSFAVIAIQMSHSILPLIGSFNVGFAAGQLAIFAPSGIGVRELVVGWLSKDTVGATVAFGVKLTLLHRLIWIVADILVFLPCLVFTSAFCKLNLKV